MKNGYLYIIRNKAWPDWVKVGITENLDKRLQTYQTASPFRDYILEYFIHHPQYLVAEKRIKEMMSHFATEIKNEWFKIDLEMAKDRLDEQFEAFERGEYSPTPLI